MTTPPLPVWYPGRSGVPGIAVASLQPQDDPFYSYTGSTPLDSIAPGTVLNTRRFHYHLFGFPTLLDTTQLLYGSTSQTGKPTVNVTSVIKPPFQFDATRVISYQSAYDSLNRNDEPSYAIWGGLRLGGVIPNVEAAVFGPFIADEWAAELAPTYAPDANEHLNGAAIGGVLVDPAHNLHYVEGTGFWAGVMAMALIGIARAFEIETELATYLSPNGARI